MLFLFVAWLVFVGSGHDTEGILVTWGPLNTDLCSLDTENHRRKPWRGQLPPTLCPLGCEGQMDSSLVTIVHNSYNKICVEGSGFSADGRVQSIGSLHSPSGLRACLGRRGLSQRDSVY
jgi:hypothetical protein